MYKAVLRIRDVYPWSQILIFTHPRSQILDPEKGFGAFFDPLIRGSVIQCAEERTRIKMSRIRYTEKGISLWSEQNMIKSFKQCCGPVTIFYGSGSEFWKVMVPVPFPTSEKLWFRFRFLFLKSYGSGSGSSSISRPYKANFSNKILEFFFAFLLNKLFYKENVYKFQQIYCKMWMKKFLMKKIKYTILNLVPVLEP